MMRYQRFIQIYSLNWNVLYSAEVYCFHGILPCGCVWRRSGIHGQYNSGIGRKELESDL